MLAKVLLQLNAVRKLILDPTNWNQRSYAMTSLGNATGFNSINATSWCLAGAVLKICSNGNDLAVKRNLCYLLDKSAHNLFCAGTIYINDILGHTAVINVLDFSIQELERGIFNDIKRKPGHKDE